MQNRGLSERMVNRMLAPGNFKIGREMLPGSLQQQNSAPDLDIFLSFCLYWK